MLKQFSRLLALILIVAMFSVSLGTMDTPSPAEAQSDEVLARIDDAMAHLSVRVGRTITRQSHFWQWQENVWDNMAMGCGVPGESYTNELTRGYRVRITVDDVEYDYRIKSDGSVLILCIDDLPDPTSIGIDTSGLGAAPAPGGTGGGTVTMQPLPVGTDWVWTYDRSGDTLYLFNPNGIQAQLPRPKLPNEAVLDGSFPVQIIISRDGRYMVESARLTNGRYGIGFYSFETGQFLQVHQTEANEEVNLGGFYAQSALVTDFASQNIAISFATFDFESGATPNPWRVIVFELATGNAVAEINNTTPQVIAAINAWGPDHNWVLNNGTTFPIPFYYDTVNGGTVHVHFVPWFTEGTPDPPTIAWVVSSTTITTSPYFEMDAFDINPQTGIPVWAKADAGYTILPAVGPYISYNAIAQGYPGSESNLWVDGTNSHFGPQIANGGNIILFSTFNGTDSRWHALDVAANTSHGLIAEIERAIASPGGFWTMTETTLAFHYPATLNVGSPVFNGILTNWQFEWASIAGVNFGLTQIAIPDTTPVAGGPSFCPGAPSSIVSSGIRARVTLSDTNPLPLRLRTTPGGEFILSISEGTEFTIIGGPQCADNYTWWQVRLDNGTTGWSAEGDSSKYFMEPAP